MLNLSALSIRYSRFVAVAVIATVVWGLIALAMLPRQEEPALTWRLANVITRWPGANPERMESLVTDPLEKAVQQVDEVEHIYSVSRAGVSLLQVELSDDVTDESPVWQRVRQELEKAKQDLPDGVDDPELDDEIMGTFAQLIALVDDEASYRDLEDHAERLEEQIRFLSTTASTSIFGMQEEVIQVEVHPARLVAYDLTLEQIAAAIRARNTRDPAGRMSIAADQLVIEASGEIASDAELRQMLLLQTPEGRTLRLGDVATVVRANPDPPQPLARFNGRRAVVLGVRARSGVRMDQFGDQIRAVIDSFRSTLPGSVSCHVAHDLADYTRGRGRELLRTFGLAISFVFLTTAVFMGWRGATIVTLAIPLTGLLVMVIFYVAGIPLNQMSVMAVIMAFGLLVDDAVVVTEQVHRRLENGPASDGDSPQQGQAALEELRQAAAEEPGKLTAPLVVSTLTTIAAFVPIYLLPGGTGEFVRAIPVGVAICLLVALLVAVTVVPWLCSLLFRGAGGDRRNRGIGVALRARCGDYFHRWLKVAVAHPSLTLSIVFFLMTGMAAFGVAIRRDFFSPVQRDQFVIDVFAPQGSSVNHTSDVVAKIEEEIHRHAMVKSTTSFSGRNAPLVFYNLQSQETYANHFAQVVVRVDHWRNTANVASGLQVALNNRISEADCVVHILEHGAPFTAPFEIRVRGTAIPALTEAGHRVMAVLKETPGVRNIRSSYGNDSIKLVAQVNEPIARRMGIDQRAVAQQLHHRVDGLVASYFREGDELLPINVRLPATVRASVTDLDRMYFKPGQSRDAIPFAAVAKLETEWEPASIYRRDGLRTLSVLAYPQFGLTAAQVSTRFDDRIRTLNQSMPEGYSLELGGESEQRHEAESNLLGGAIYAVFPILLLLIAEFRSIRLSLLILCLVPLCLAGVMMGLFVTGWPLNFMAIMGMMMLFGIVINDALILVDGFESRRAAGEDVADLVVAGTMERSRHIVITTATTIAGFLPLAISPSLLWPPLAIALIGGLAVATLLTLFAIPAAYVVLYASE